MTLTLISRNGDGSIEPPRTKKNSAHVRCPYQDKGVRFHQPVYQDYERWARGCARASIYDRTAPAIDYEVNCAALIYRDRNVGDAAGFYQAIADCLEAMGVVKNDRLIVTWDGTRLRKDPENPRVEVTLTPAEGAQLGLGLLSAAETRSEAQRRKKERKLARV